MEQTQEMDIFLKDIRDSVTNDVKHRIDDILLRVFLSSYDLAPSQ